MGSTELGDAFLPSLALACSAARSCRQSLLTHRGRRWPPSHCQSPWSHQEWQRDGRVGLGFTTLGVKQTKKLRHREAPSCAPFVWETESNLCRLIPGAAGVQRAWATSAHALWVRPSSWHWGSGQRPGTGLACRQPRPQFSALQNGSRFSLRVVGVSEGF